MKYKTSYFNRAILGEDFKRLWGVAALYFIAVFLTGPLQIMLRMGDPNRSITYIVKDFLETGGSEMQGVYSIVFAILLPLLIYRYLHTINSTTVIHSFPITRRELFHSHNLAGFLLILIPALVNMLFLVGLMVTSNDGSIFYQEIFTMKGIMIWTGKTLLVNIVIYLIATLTAMVTGTTIIQGVLSFIFIFLPIGLGRLIMINLDQLLYGFTINNNSVEKILIKIIPIITVWSNEEIGMGLLFGYLLLSLALYVAALYLYKIRHLERATDPISIDGLKPIFKYGVTFCAMVLGGAYFYSFKRADLWLYIGYVIGGYLGYLIAEMLIQKTIWVFKNMKGFVIYALIIMVAFAGIKLDITGFEKRVPATEKIQNVYYGYGVYPYRNGDQEGLEELENIESVRELHSEIIKNKSEFRGIENNRDTSRVGIAYQLKNGRTIYREYLVPTEFVQNNAAIKDIVEDEEYKRSYYGIFKIDPAKIDYIAINPEYSYGINKNVKIISPDEIQGIIEVTKQDILEESYEEYTSRIVPWADIRLVSRESTEKINKDSYVPWKKSYDNLSKWLQEKGYYQNIRVMPEDVDYMVVEKVDGSREKVRSTVDLDQLGENGKSVEIRDKAKIEYLLNNHQRHYGAEETYLLGIYFNNGNNFMGSISEERLPQDIKDTLN